MSSLLNPAFIREAHLLWDKIEAPQSYPFSLPAIAKLQSLTLDPHVNFFVGENGTGKSTLLEAIAVAAGFNPEGGTRNFSFSTRADHSPLHRYLRLVKGTRRWTDGFFLRAESYFNVAKNIEDLDKEPGPGPPIISSYGGTYLHEMSHGESFLALMEHRLGGNGVYIFDEPEAALSPARQLKMMVHMKRLASKNSQFIIATHSPILMGYPGARIYAFSGDGIEQVRYEETDHYVLTKRFLVDYPKFMERLLHEDEDS